MVDEQTVIVEPSLASSNCRVCNRPLTDPESVSRGIGPVCAQCQKEEAEIKQRFEEYDFKPQLSMEKLVSINDIKIGDRFRKDIGDINSLAKSIVETGLLHSIVLTSDNKLVAGYRRIKAFEKLGLKVIPARTVSLEDLRKGEVQENVQRKGFTVSEIAAIDNVIGEEIRAEHPKGKHSSGKLPDDNRDRVAKYVGVSGKTLEKAKKITEAAERQPELYKTILEKADNGLFSIDRAYKHVIIKEKQQEIKQNGSPPLPEGIFDVIYADPPWKYDYNGSLRGKADIHYSTMELKDIQILPIPEKTADNSLLLLWSTNTFLEDALKIMKAWGFSYKTCFVWVKDHIGTGFWLRNQHELLLLGVKGEFPHPADEDRVSSIINAPYTEHSAKPQIVYSLIEKMWPNRKYLELFARNQREGWISWGVEV